MNRAESNELKAFITRQSDIARKAYGRRSQSYPRQCVFVGTTNDDEYLKDATGGRRFWCVKATRFDLDGLLKDRDQLWAEAYASYSLGEALYLDDASVREYAEDEQSSRLIVDEIQTRIESIVDSEGFPDQFDFNDIWSRLAFEDGRSKICEYQMQLRIKKALRCLGYPKIRIRNDGVRGFLWLKHPPKSLFDAGYLYKKY